MAEKAPEVQEILDELSAQSHGEALPVDYWDIDSSAGGVARKDDPRVLAYVSVSTRHGAQAYFVECELTREGLEQLV